MWQATKKLFKISRPISWVNTAYPFAAGYIVTGGDNWQILVVGSLFFLIPYNLLMYGVNDVFDYESDIKNPRKGGIEGAVEQKAFHPTILLTSFGLTLPFLVWLIVNGDLSANLVLLASVFFVIAYSIKYLRFKEVPILDSITSSVHFVSPLIYALVLTASLEANWVIIAAFLLWGMASHALGAIQDIIPDREGSLSSIATVLGARPTIWLVFSFYLASSLLIMTVGLYGFVIGLAGLIYALNCLPYLGVSDQTSSTVNRAWRRFIWLNLFVGFVITICLILQSI